jgi:pimeloyl-ACP methyl ester carboxylesterase
MSGQRIILAALSALAILTPGSAPAAGAPGELIRVSPLTTSAALPDAGRNLLVLYHSRIAEDRDVTVSGVISTPRGKPPAGGWPVVVWTHGTTGMAAECAPSRDMPDGPEHAYLGLTEAFLDRLARRGYAIVATDYAGLGTPGVQPYLLGRDEGRNAIDLLRAARRLNLGVGRRYVVMGHSQGGQSALFTTAIGPSYAPELTLLGGVAIAPASDIRGRIERVSVATRPSPILVFSLYALQAYAARHPTFHLTEALSAEASAHLADLGRGCFDQAVAAGYWSTAIPSRQFRRPFVGAELPDFALDTDPGQLRITAPALVIQGLSDTFVPPAGTRSMALRLCRAGARLRLSLYPGEDHVSVLERSRDEASAWIDGRFAERPESGACSSL